MNSPLDNSTCNDIWRAVNSAIDSGCTADDFKAAVAEHWNAALAEKAERDDKVLRND